MLSINLYSQSIPTQTEYLTKNLWRLFVDIPTYQIRELNDLAGITRFDFYYQSHLKNKSKSPFHLFKGNKHNLEVSDESSFAFNNTVHEFSDIVRLDFGVCSGMAFLLRKFHRLSYFDPDNLINQNVPTRENHEEWVKFYYKKFKNIQKNKVEIFPYFKNLNELSSDPVFKDLLKRITLDEWVIRNVNVSGIKQVLETRKDKLSKKEINKLYKDINQRLNLNYKPIIYLAAKSPTILTKNHSLHVVNVTGIKRDNDNIIIYSWDNNHQYLPKSFKKLIIDNNGEISGDYKEIHRVGLIPHDDFEVAQILRSKISWCNKTRVNTMFCSGLIY